MEDYRWGQSLPWAPIRGQCYDRGGSQPTITDANLVLGRLGSELVRGELPLNRDKAYTAIEQHIARPLNLSVETAAHGMLEILHNNMAGAIRAISIERGYDPREFALLLVVVPDHARWPPGRLARHPDGDHPRYHGYCQHLAS